MKRRPINMPHDDETTIKSLKESAEIYERVNGKSLLILFELGGRLMPLQVGFSDIRFAHLVGATTIKSQDDRRGTSREFYRRCLKGTELGDPLDCVDRFNHYFDQKAQAFKAFEEIMDRPLYIAQVTSDRRNSLNDLKGDRKFLLFSDGWKYGNEAFMLAVVPDNFVSGSYDPASLWFARPSTVRLCAEGGPCGLKPCLLMAKKDRLTSERNPDGERFYRDVTLMHKDLPLDHPDLKQILNTYASPKGVRFPFDERREDELNELIIGVNERDAFADDNRRRHPVAKRFAWDPPRNVQGTGAYIMNRESKSKEGRDQR